MAATTRQSWRVVAAQRGAGGREGRGRRRGKGRERGGEERRGAGMVSKKEEAKGKREEDAKVVEEERHER